MNTQVDVQTLDNEITFFNDWKGPARIYYDKEKNYFFTETFANDVQASSTVIMNEGVSCVYSKKERDTNKNIGEKRKAYIVKFAELLQKGYEAHEAEYHLAEEI